MIREVPKWVNEIRQEINGKILELGIGYGIPGSLIFDSKRINDSVDIIADSMENLYYRSNKKPDSLLGCGNIKFGELRKKTKTKR
jgi:hypothetical protein